MASSTSSPLLSSSPSVQILDQKFGRKGVKFSEFGGVPAVDLTVRNGSSLKLQLSDGLVTSYKPKVYWKDEAFEELLYTVSEGNEVKKGGIGMGLDVLSLDGEPWCPSGWEVKDVDSDSIDAVQVELSCSNGDGTLEVTYIVTLFPESMATAVIAKNNGSQTVKLSSGILSHLKFKGRGGSAISGLTGCSYTSHPPLASSFGIISPVEAMEPEQPGWFSSIFNGNGSTDSRKKREKGQWTVENNNFVMLRERMSRVYAAPPAERAKRVYRTPPSKYETIDQGTGLEFRMIRMGYEDIYLGCPGSLSRKYGNNYFICTGPASMLVPVELKPNEMWRGAQVIEHDNL
ncbi:hypothetical protein AMTRI_Chr03g149070 [Amborella trichopoda]|uniref:Uncharacterized protein n=1 Tax=Amborella trichopoda TaxID=13333 RepID=W1NDW7_AMBTC|nr:photosynthetic NDH subunit of subcomplex B 2, chloroplastic [Amborella trichopoda]ERM93548.1 hypothetical protein AMTR_s00004p00079630 [Amborella trichopoda]|eukprot:XP_006826311.1 photosynthetic NDH subunit of subcomplex B 2, chloroplastic [Amborella trichopoda]